MFSWYLLKNIIFDLFNHGLEMLICKTYFSKLQSNWNFDNTIIVYVIKKRTFGNPNSRPGETDPYMGKFHNDGILSQHFFYTINNGNVVRITVLLLFKNIYCTNDRYKYALSNNFTDYLLKNIIWDFFTRSDTIQHTFQNMN